jgi:DNA-directed RNA polymerase specialized sigma24 family protein
MLSVGVTFEEFAQTAGRRLRAGLIAAYGVQAGLESTAEALAYGWEHWDRLSRMSNPAGYLYRVGQTAARRERRPQCFLPVPPPIEPAPFEPQLIPALERLTEHQRVVVVLTCAYGWHQSEVAELLDISCSSVRTHQSRALAKLAEELEMTRHGD